MNIPGGAGKKEGAQIDLLIDRRDDVINLCEMKYTNTEYSIDAEYEAELLQKAEVFRNECKTDKAIHITLVSVNGLKRNAHSDAVQNVITGEELF